MTLPSHGFATRRVLRSPERAGDLSALVDRLAEELTRRWRSGERPAVEEFLSRHPELETQPEAALELIAEEIYLRAEDGEDLAAADFLGRFPRWARQVEALLDCHRLMAPGLGAARFPALGETLGEFRILAEIGRGANGRVFLARQAALADRPVVLKLAPEGSEHLSLSRLQHTHIVPLHSVHEFPERGLHGLCLPYFGGASLAKLLHSLRDVRPSARSGSDLVRVLEASQEESAALPVRGPVCAFLKRASYVEAVCWIGACLADALQYAHERGLIHLDLKPSNVLLAADGQPMLLDFHLARAPLTAGGPAPSDFGGTPGYMAPEHQAALAAVAGRHEVPAAVDGRADVYSLGVTLYEELGGEVPVPQQPGDALRRRNGVVSPGLADILDRCLSPESSARYGSAAALADDLRRHLADRPLRGVPNRSLAERWAKWRRRRPYALPLLTLLLVSVLAAGSLVVLAARQASAARAAFAQGETYLQQKRYAEALEAFRAGVALSESLPFDGGLRQQLRGAIDAAERGKAAGELHLLCERLRPLYGVDWLPTEQTRVIAGHCREFWNRRELIAGRLAGPDAPETEEQVRADLLDLAILWADLRVRQAPHGETQTARQEALAILDQAESLFGPSRILSHERRAHALALGRLPGADEPDALTPRSGWEHYALGRAYLRDGDLRRAAEHFDRAVELEPRSLWHHFGRGVCADRRGQHEDALVAFSACVALSPSAVCYFNRARAYAALGRADRASRDCERALQLDPELRQAGELLARLRTSP